jgi:bacterioferritin-associated ferredoxin
MKVCFCFDVTEEDIQSNVKAGCHSFSGLANKLGVATGCGSCYSDVLSILEQNIPTSINSQENN